MVNNYELGNGHDEPAFGGDLGHFDGTVISILGATVNESRNGTEQSIQKSVAKENGDYDEHPEDFYVFPILSNFVK